jgi:hypothetical protein
MPLAKIHVVEGRYDETRIDCPARGKARRSPNLPFTFRGRRMACKSSFRPWKKSAPAFPASWGISNSTMWGIGYNTKPLPRSVTSS